MNWTLSGGDSVDFYLISITTNASQIPYGGLLNISTASITLPHKLTGFHADYEYNITVRGVNCGSQEGSESEPLTIRPEGGYISGLIEANPNDFHASLKTDFRCPCSFSLSMCILFATHR